MGAEACSTNTIDERAARVVAGFVVLTALIAATVQSLWWLMPLLAIDFGLRAWVDRRYSPLRWIAKRILAAANVEPRPVYAPPKRFAARIGFVITVLVSVLHVVGMHEFAVALSAVLAIAASLEAFAGICIACWLYPFVTRSRTV